MGYVAKLTPLTGLVVLAASLFACSASTDDALNNVSQALSYSGSVVGYDGKCLDVRASSTADGTPVQMYQCNGSPAQQWTYVNGKLYGIGGKCLEAANGAGSTDGAKLQLASCATVPHQGWGLSGGQIVGVNGKCIDAAATTEDGVQAQIWSCSGQWNQQFSFSAVRGSYFYGANVHWDYQWSPQQIVDGLHQINSKRLRINTGGNTVDATNRANYFVSEIRKIDPGIRVLGAMDTGYDWTVSESDNYWNAYKSAYMAASSLGSVGVTDFECGNELTSRTDVFPHNAAGDAYHDYVSGGGAWRSLRATISGLVDGVHAVNPSFRAFVNFVRAQTAASDMLWNGWAPNGTDSPDRGAFPPIHWDVTSWHNYRIDGDIFRMGTNAHGNSFNVMEYVHNAYGRPIEITEWNANNSDDEDTRTAWTTQFLSEAYAYRNAYNIESVMVYQLGNDARDWGLLQSAKQTTAYSLFTAGNW